MGRPVHYFPGSASADLARGLPPPFVASPWVDAPPAAPAPAPAAILLADGVPGELARAAAAAGTRTDVVIVALARPGALPETAPEEVAAWLPPDPPPGLVRLVLEGALARGELRRAYEDSRPRLAALASELRELTAIGIGLSVERDVDTLLELILTRARAITGSDAGSLYLVETGPTGGRELRFRLVQNDSAAAPFKESTLAIDSGSVAGHAALTGRALNLEDAYAPPPGARFRLDQTFDQQAGYLTRSMLVVPMKTPAGEVLGVLQLINRKADPERRFASIDEIRRHALPFSPHAEELACFLASQAAVALQNARLYAELRAALRTVEDSQRRVIQAERLRALGEMAGGVAHDFNNILAVVMGRTQLLLRQTADPALVRQLEIIEQTAAEGAQTVRRVQEFARVRRTRPFRPVDLPRVVEEAVEAARPWWQERARARGVEFDVRADPGLLLPVPVVVGDPGELRDSVLAILLNALDAMPRGGMVTLSTGFDGTWVRCAIADGGVGMAEVVRRRVFEPFFTTKPEPGTGLGLSIVYGIVSRHGGHIDVRSRPNEGSVFTIRLPAAAPRPAMAAPRPGGAGARILVMEDPRRGADLLVELLRRHGLEAVACPDAPSGLARLADPFDLVMIDLGMPGPASGWAVAARARVARPTTPIVLVTGWGHQLDPDDPRQHGIDYVVARPFDAEALMAVVTAALAPADRNRP